MALRRVLPSRSTPEKSPDGAATATSKPASTAPRNTPAVTEALAEPIAAPVASTSVTSSDAFAAAATSAFSTLPTAAPARVLEDSFTKPDIKPQQVETPAEAPVMAEPAFTAPAWEMQVSSISDSFVAPQPTALVEPESAPVAEPAFVAPAWDVPAPTPVEVVSAPANVPEVPAEQDTFVAPAWEAEVKAAAEAAAANTARLAELAAMPAPTPEPEVVYVAPAWEAPASFASQSPVSAPILEVAVPAPSMDSSVESASPFLPTVPEVVAVPDIATAPVAVTVPEIEVVAIPAPQEAPVVQASAEESQSSDVEPQEAGTTFDFQPSRPDNNQRKRRVRDKRPRDFTAMGAPENQAADRPKPTTSFASHVPVDTRPLDKVDEALINSGVMAPRPLDSLTGALPSGLAETEFEPQPEPEAYTPPEPQRITPPPITRSVEPPAPPVAGPIPIVVPDAPEATKAEITPAEQDILAPIAIPQTPVAPPAFNLSNTQPAPVEAPLPPPQSDLPWTQTQAAAEWEIETPDSASWHAETGQDAAASTPAAAHMPPPTADLYKSLGTSGKPPELPGGNIMAGIPSRTGSNFTPELPGQRRKSGGGTPWALIAVGVLAAAGGAAYLMRSGGTGQVQQQLASLTSKAGAVVQQADSATSGILPPPRTENASFYTPPMPSAADTSSSALVNFADVPASEANQPIVATGKEDMPKDLSFFGKMSAEVEKVRAAKAAGQPLDADLSATTPSATASAAITPDKLQEELAAYRTALSQSANPASLTPTAFKRDPDGYMDGKTGVTDGAGSPTGAAGAALASGALLPPPSADASAPPPNLYTNNPKNLPVVNEPVANAPTRVRTLADFPDIQPYTPEREKVEIPKNLKPKMAATDFPALEVLSFVPGKGIVAFADGREGVLLIGESINGWELVGVTADNAEFKAGQKSYQLTSDN